VVEQSKKSKKEWEKTFTKMPPPSARRRKKQEQQRDDREESKEADLSLAAAERSLTISRKAEKENRKNRRYILCIAFMVKNEAKQIADIIKNWMEALKDYPREIFCYCVLDTGSTDGTQKIMADTFAELEIPGQIHEEPWNQSERGKFQFDGPRTRLQRLCDTSGATYNLVIDGDDTVTGKIELPKLMNLDCYKLQFNLQNVYHRAQIFRCNIGWMYDHNVHEGARLPDKAPMIRDKNDPLFVVAAPTRHANAVFDDVNGVVKKIKYAKKADKILPPVTEGELALARRSQTLYR
jgi:hypothetical protein